MKFIPQSISDVVLIVPKIHGDERGYFVETYKKSLFEDAIGYNVDFVQDNESKSAKGVLRGLHYQLPPYSQAKLVRVIDGSVLDVVVDVRKSSVTFGQHLSVNLTAENQHQLFVPHGFAHGFVVLSASATFAYKVDNYYKAGYERGIKFDDESLKIDWQLPLEDLYLSEKDKRHPPLANANDFF